MRAVIQHQRAFSNPLRKALAVVGFLTAAATPLFSQTLHGQVVDSVNAQPITGLDVVLLDAQRDTVAVTKSGTEGRFVFTAPAGKYMLCVRCIGHRPKQLAVEVPSDTAVIVRLAQINVQPGL